MSKSNIRPRCLACDSAELNHEAGDRHQCEQCGYRVVISDNGTVDDWMCWRTAGPKRRARR